MEVSTAALVNGRNCIGRRRHEANVRVKASGASGFGPEIDGIIRDVQIMHNKFISKRLSALELLNCQLKAGF